MTVEPRRYRGLDTRRRRNLTDAYIRDQHGLCNYCGNALRYPSPLEKCGVQINFDLFSPFFFGSKTHLDHDHETGMTRGVVHAYCNAVAWDHEGK